MDGVTPWPHPTCAYAVTRAGETITLVRDPRFDRVDPYLKTYWVGGHPLSVGEKAGSLAGRLGQMWVA